jgi:hypothetical protein
LLAFHGLIASLGQVRQLRKSPPARERTFLIFPQSPRPASRQFQNLVENPMKSPRAVGIPFCDEQGRYADFHSLRYSWATYLQRQGVNSRMAMELMRHYDRRLTDKVYTDTNLLPLQQSMRNISEDVPLMHILMHICGKTGQSLSQSVATDQSSDTTETSVTVGDRRELSQSDDLRVWWRWRESKSLRRPSLFSC